MNAEHYVVTVLVVLLIAALAVANNRFVRRPSHDPSAYVSYCARRGYQFVPERDGAQTPYAYLVPIFGKVGYTRSWRNEMSGTLDGRRFLAFEYMYAIGGARGGQSFRHAVVKWELPGAGLPTFNVLPADFFQLTSIEGRPPAVTLTVPSDPAFSAAFIAVGDPSWLERVLSPELRAAMVERADNHLAGSGDVLFWWLDVPLPDADGMDELLGMAARFSRLVLKASDSGGT